MSVRVSTGRAIRVGSVVRVIGFPPLVGLQPRETQRIFRAVIGHRFKVHGIVRKPGIPRLVELRVDRVVVPIVGGHGHSIWIEPEHLG